MPETTTPAADFSADADLIRFFKVIPDGRYRCGVRYLVVAAAGGPIAQVGEVLRRPLMQLL